MMDELVATKECVLLVGEGNFSFSLDLKRKLSPSAQKMVATCYEDDAAMSRPNMEGTLKNVKLLKQSGSTVITGVDASQLHEHPILSEGQFDCVIFQFPHVGGKGNVTRNRILLKRFFESASEVITHDGTILVTLCNGQGGTPADSPQREWCNSWQVVAMGTHGDLILTGTMPFSPDAQGIYKSTGYRSQDKSFNTSGAVVHVFHKSPRLPVSPMERLACLQRVSNIQLEMYRRISAQLYQILRSENPKLCLNKTDAPAAVGKVPQERNPLAEGGMRTHYEQLFTPSILENPTPLREEYVFSDVEQDTSCPDSLMSFLVDKLSGSDIQTIHCCVDSCAANVIDESSTLPYTVELIRKPCPISSLYSPIMHYAVISYPDNSDTSSSNMPLSQSLQSLRNKVLHILCKVIPQSVDIEQNVPTFTSEDIEQCAVCNTETDTETFHLNNFKVPIDISFAHNDRSTAVVVCLEELVLNKLGLDDIRLLWSSDPRWWTRLSRLEMPTVRYSMYPPCHVHDLSFWEPDGGTFDEEEFLALIRETAGDDLKEVKLIDTFELDGRRSRCYKMVYQSCDQALTNERAGTLQGIIREVVTTKLGLIPR